MQIKRHLDYWIRSGLPRQRAAVKTPRATATATERPSPFLWNHN